MSSYKSRWDTLPKDVQDAIISEYVTIKWHTLNQCFKEHDYAHYKAQKNLLYHLFGRQMLIRHEDKVLSLATCKYGDLVEIGDSGALGYVIDAIFIGGCFSYKLSGYGNRLYPEYCIGTIKGNRINEWNGYKIGGIVNPQLIVEPIPNVRNPYGVITEMYEYKDSVVIIADYGIVKGNFENIFTDVFIKQKEEPVDDSNINVSKVPKTYLMRDENTGKTKIGRSINPRKREKTLLSDSPVITLFAVCERNVEKELHSKYAAKRVRGEWFDLTQSDIKQICNDYQFHEVK